LSVASLLWIGIPASAQSPTQQAQPTATRDNDTTVKELSSFDGFLDSHPEIAEHLRKDPSQVKNEEFLEQHPELRQYLRNHPGVQEEISENPRAFMHEERGFERQETRGELSRLDAFLDRHQEIAEQLRKNPSLVNDRQFLQQHPELQQFLQDHGNIAAELRRDPNVFMREEQRFDQREDGRDRDMTRGQLAGLDRFLDSHPEIAEQLQKNPALVNDKKFVHDHPALQSYLQQHPEVREEFRENPNAFMQQEQRFDQREEARDRDMTHGQLANMDRFLDSHPEIAEQLRKNPALVNDEKFVKDHPALQSYLQQHPGVREEFSENPNGVMQQEQRFDQREESRDRDMTRGQLAGMDRFLDSHPEVAEQLRKNPSLVNDKKFVDQHPALQSYLQQHPGVREEFRENPNAFMRQEQRFDRQEDYGRGAQGFDRDGSRSEAANFGQFLGIHANIAAQISKDPSLVNNKEFMESHPELRDYLKTHPAAQAQLQQNPQAFLQSAQQAGSKPVPKVPPVAQPMQKKQR
jgi:hypothetical protein